MQGSGPKGTIYLRVSAEGFLLEGQKGSAALGLGLRVL